ncbi:polyprotein of EF-Ts, chloroplastic [Typha angustifolia]|uniref:polyprotein of EF-Ts, chloroplastic n=1 Tax=Typha angustifolia TaxID=59011 RepID=UPI003C2B5CCA
MSFSIALNMTPVIHCSSGNISLFSRGSFSARKEFQLTKCNASGRYTRLPSSCQKLLLAQPALQLIRINNRNWGLKHRSATRIIAAVGTDVTVEEPNSALSGEVADEIVENPDSSVGAGEPAPASPAVTSPARSKYPRSIRKSEMPPVKDEELVPGASFTGKVRSIQPFGAFVDFGAYTDGLVHVSRMSDGYVKDVAAVVSIGQEVKVRIVEANKENGRISLTMRDSDDASKVQQKKETSTSGNSERTRGPRKNTSRSNTRREGVQKSTKLVKGQVLNGTVKNLTRSGAFVTLPEGEEGFLPVSEESEGFGGILGNSSLQAGQEVNVRVLRVARGQVTLTMKQKEDVEGLNKKLSQGVVHVATNPFQIAFRSNKEISSFLDEREKIQKLQENLTISEASEEKVDETVTNSEIDSLTSSDQLEDKKADIVSESTTLEVDNSTTSSNELESANNDSEKQGESASPKSSSVDEAASEDEDSSGATISETDNTTVELEGSLIREPSVVEALSVTDEAKDSDVVVGAVFEDDVSSKTLTVGESPVEVKDNSGSEISKGDNENLASQEVVPEVVATYQSEDTITDGKTETATPVLAEKELASTEVNDSEKVASEVSNDQNGVVDGGNTIKATISPALVKQLREETGAGMMDCKKALAETGGDIIKAQEFLRKKGLASADKKASRATAEGRIGSYIHDNRIGILIEVNCETDFVSRGEIFKELVDDLAMQVAAYPQVQYLVTEDVPEEIVNKERDIEMQKEDLLNKPEQIRSKIVEGRIRKRLEEFALLEQPYIKNDKMVVKDWVKQTIATIGENIKVKRFVRYNLGEGLEKKSQDFAAEVAAQTTAKTAEAVPKDKSVETTGTPEKSPSVAISAALVKQLREETGAGMMDCKKALSETGGDLEKAQEYLRKKGLSSADKKSSRLAAEGRISAYIHDARIGCLIEVNSETDFVGRNEKFKELVDDLAMQVVACPQVQFVSLEDIPESIIKNEKEIEMQREDLQSKPEQIREKIVDGRISKRLGELALLEQPFIKDDSIMVKDLVKQTVAALGENIKVRRFVRFTLGESEE